MYYHADTFSGKAKVFLCYAKVITYFGHKYCRYNITKNLKKQHI